MRNRSFFAAIALVAWMLLTAVTALQAQDSPADSQVVRTYDISFMNLKEPESLPPSPRIGFNSVRTNELMSLPWSEFMIEILSTAAFAEIQVISRTNTELQILATPAEHDNIASALAGLKAIVARQVDVSTWLMKVDGAVLDGIMAENAKQKSGMLLTEKQFATLRGASRQTEEFQQTLMLRQTGEVLSTKQISYLADFNALVSASASGFEPIKGQFNEGIRFQMTPNINFAGNMVRLDVNLTRSNLVEMESFDPSVCDNIDLPEEDTLTVTTSVLAPDTAYVLVGAVESIYPGSRETMVLVARPRIKPAGAAVQGFLPILKTGDAYSAFFDMGAAGCPMMEYQSPEFPLYETSNSSFPLRYMPEYAERFQGIIADQNISYTRINDIFIMNMSSDKAMLARLETDARNWSNSAEKTVTIEAVFCLMEDKMFEGLLAPVESSKRAPIILDAISKNPGLKLGSCVITGYENQAFGAHRLNNKCIISDVTPIIASQVVYDPSVAIITQGIMLQARPTTTEGGKKVTVDLDTYFKMFEKPVDVYGTAKPGGIRFHQPTITNYQFNSIITLDAGQFTCVVMPSPSLEGKGYMILLLRASVK